MNSRLKCCNIQFFLKKSFFLYFLRIFLINSLKISFFLDIPYLCHSEFGPALLSLKSDENGSKMHNFEKAFPDFKLLEEFSQNLDPINRLSYLYKYLGLNGARNLIEIVNNTKYSSPLSPNLLDFWPKEMYRVNICFFV